MTDLFFFEASTAAGLRDAFRARVEQLKVSRERLDEVTGLPSGYSGKLLSQGEAKDPKRIGALALDLLLPATGLKLVLVDDRDALAKITPMLVERAENQVRVETHWRTGHRAEPQPVSKKRKKAKSVRLKRGGKYA